MKENKKKRSVLIKTAVVLVALVLLQSVIFTLFMTLNGVVSSINSNSEKVLYQYASKRSIYMETEMLKKWSDIGGTVSSANATMARLAEEAGVSAKEIFSRPSLMDRFSEEFSAELLKIMRSGNVSGAYVVMCNNADMPDETMGEALEGVFFIDSAPDDNPEDCSDVIMLNGSSTISSKYNIPLDVSWSSNFTSGSASYSSMDFFYQPVKAAHRNPNFSAANLGCWSSVFTVNGGNDYHADVISYSVPLIYDGQVYGVTGVCISVEQLLAFMPSDEIDSHGNGGYLLVNSDNWKEDADGFNAYVQAVSGKMLESSISSGEMLKLNKVNGTNGLYSVKGVEINGSKAYCTLEKMNLYKMTSPHYGRSWIILAVLDENDLFGTSELLTHRLIAALICSFLICSVIAVVLAWLGLRPVSVLAKDADSVTESNAAPMREFAEDEFYAISCGLHRLSNARNHYIRELKAESERHLIMLKTANCSIFEYDCTDDVFTVYHFSDENNYRNEYRNFRSLVFEGRICPEEDIPSMLKFIEGRTESKCQMRVYAKDGKLKWNSVTSSCVSDDNGNLLKVVACSYDITDEKLEEERRNEMERRDAVTGFYSSVYGKILVEKNILESREENYSIAVISLRNANEFIQYHGAFYFDGIIEEIGLTLKKFTETGNIVWRMSISDIAVYLPGKSRADFEESFKKAYSYISRIYSKGDEEKRFICRIGVSDCGNDTELSNALDMARQALCAAEMPHYPDIVYYEDVRGDVNARAAMVSSKFTDSSADASILSSGYIVTDNVVSYALNMLEKAKNIKCALHLVFGKAGYKFGFNRIAMYDINYDFMSLGIYQQWCRYDINELDEAPVRLEKEAFEECLSFLSSGEYIVIDREYYIGSESVQKIVDDFRYGGKMAVIPVVSKDRTAGFISFSGPEEAFEALNRDSITEIARIAATYLDKSRTSIESKAKSSFLSSMSHEIRTPMNAIMGMTAIALKNDELDDGTRDCLNKINSSADYLLALINDILDMSRIESGKMTVEETFTDINDIISQADIINRIRIEENHNRFIVEKKIKYPYLVGDPMKIKQVLVNILGNASKFTENGSVTLSVVQDECNDDGIVNVHFSVKDTGIGISKENVGKIFSAFEQAEKSTARKYGGTGLGLAISSSYVKMMGGTLKVESEEGKGSEFSFTLPMRRALKSDAPIKNDSTDRNSVDFKTKRILLAEDDDLNVEIARTLLEAEGLTVETACDGSVAVEMFEASESGYYDAVLMDIRMPVMDGLEATKLIRQSGRKDAESVPIIAMTANAFDDDMKKSVECGMNGHLSKPIDMNKVIETLVRVWR